MEGKTISNFIMKIDINTLANEEMSYGKKQENAIHIESTSNLILKHYQIDRESDATDYYVDLIKDGKKRNIIKSNYSSGNGELLINIFGEKDSFIFFESLMNRGEIIIFDTVDEKFSEILIKGENVLNIIRDSNGNIIVTTDEDNGVERFYYVKRSFLI